MDTYSLIVNTSTRRFVNPKYPSRLLPCSKIPTMYYMDKYELELTLLNSDFTPYQIPEGAIIRFAGDVNRTHSDNLMVYSTGNDIVITDAAQGKLTVKVNCNASAFYEKAGCDMIISLTINDSTVLDDRVFARRGAYTGEVKDIVVGEDLKPWDYIKAYIDERADHVVFPVVMPRDAESAYLEVDWSQNPDFSNPVFTRTLEDTGEVYAFNGETWEVFPLEGVTKDYTNVRVPWNGKFYRYRYVYEDKATEWNPVPATIDISQVSYTDESGATLAVGGWAIGDKATQMSFQDFAYKLLHPYEKPTISLTLNPPAQKYTYGDVLEKITLTANVTRKSKAITAVGFYVNNQIVHLITTDVANGGAFAFEYIPDEPMTSTQVFKVEATDGDTTVSATKTVSWVGESYFGYLPYSEDIGTYGPDTPIDIDVIKGQEVLLNTSKAMTVNNINIFDSHIMYAYPAVFGTLTSIVDAMGFSYMESYQKYNIVIDDIDYYVYFLKDAATVENFKQVYA